MPKKVPFRVIYCSGWEDDYPPKDLEVHSPFIKGWRSPRYCLYPQELVIRIDPAARIRKLQLLSHQYMIASKIELFVGRFPSDAYTSVDQAQFSRLGYVSLSDNEQTGFRSRELKSINLDCTGQLIKLVLHQNHINRLNLFNQVSLVALNLLADSLDSLQLPPGGGGGGEEVGVAGSLPSHVTHYVDRNPKNESLSEIVHSYLPSYRHTHPGAPATDPVLLGTINKTSRINPMDDLAFAIAQDPETADLIRKLDIKKSVAVKEERFEHAKRLKQVIDELQRIGEVLCRYEVEKKLAVEREDYDTAKEKKEQLERIRQQVYDQLGIHGLLSGGGGGVGHHVLRRSTERSGYHPRVKNTPFTSRSSVSTLFSGQEESRDVDSLIVGRQSVVSGVLPPLEPSLSAHSPSPPPHHDPADERPLPTLVNKKSQSALETVVEQAEPGETGEEKDERPEPLSEKQLNEVPIAIEVFSMEVVEYVYAKQYQLRERGLHQVQEILSTSEVHSRKELSTMVKATVQILKKGLNDKVLSTFSGSIDLLKYLVGPYAQQHKLSKPELHHIVEKIVPVLLKRTGDTSPRIHTGAVETVRELAQDNQLKGLGVVGPLLVEPIKMRSAPWKVAKSRIELLESLNQDPGLEAGGLTVKKVMEFISPCLEHTNGFVRDEAIKLTLDLYRLYGNEIRQYLPRADNSGSRKKTLWKTLFEGFDQIDGKPSQADKEAAKLATQKAQNEEIEKLRDQAKQLRELVAERNIATEGESSGVVDQPPPPASLRPPSEEEQRQRQREEEPHPDDSLDTTCVFCGEQRDDFDTKMEQHYLTDCPMLLSCSHCKQVIEISGLTRHWLTECEAKGKFKECPRCKEAIHTNLYEGHVRAKNCRVAVSGEDKSRCPLCHLDIPAGDEGWKSHLMGSGAGKCLKNARRKQPPSSAGKGGRGRARGIPRAVPAGGAATGSRTNNRPKPK